MFERFFISILNMSLVASYVIIFVIIARFFLKKAPKIFSYALWSVVLFRLICPFSFESGLSFIPTSKTPIPQDIIYSETPKINTGISVVDTLVNPILPVSVSNTVSINPIQIWIYIGTVIWLLGILLMIGYSVISFIKLKRSLITATPLRDNIYVADHISTPFVMGLFKSKIYIPSTLLENEQNYIIAHEICHIKRLDHITRILGFVALSIHWFNPLVWIGFILSGKDMELSCDEAVMKTMDIDIRVQYSQSLLRFATGRKLITATPLAFGEGDTKERIKNVLKYKKTNIWILIIAVIAIVCLFVALGTNQKDKKTIQDGTYSMIVQDDEIGGSITIDGEKFTFRYDMLSNYLAYGNYEIKDNILILSTNDGIFKYLFTIEGENLIFQENESSSVKLTDNRVGVEIVNGSVFSLNNSTLDDLQPMIMVDGKLYIDTGKKVSSNEVIWKGTILSTVNSNKKPSKDSQSNFGGMGTSYSLDEEGLILATNEIGIGIRFVPEKLTHEQAVTFALTSSSNHYLEGECFAEGHIILGYDNMDKNKTKIYALTMKGWYGFENDNFVKVSGSGIIPAVITLDGNNKISIEYPLDGSEYKPSIEKIFPEKYQNRIFNQTKEDYNNLKQQETQYAKKYLSEIGRDAKIGEYSDFQHTLLTHVGVSVEVSNKLQEFYKNNNYYPNFIGTRELLENGARMVYEMTYDKNQDEIKFIKYKYQTKEIIEQFIVNAKTGNIEGTAKTNR